MSLPKRPGPHVTDAMAMDAISSAVHNLGWVFRPLTGSTDYGIDGEIEVRSNEGQMTGAIIRVQVKGNSSAISEARGVNVKLSTIRYWLVSPIPVFMIKVNPEKEVFVLHVESYLVECKKMDYVQTTGRKTLNFKFDTALPFSECIEFLEEVALEHQSAVLDINNYSLYNPSLQLISSARLFYQYHGDIDAMLKDYRDNVEDDRLIYEYGHVVFLKRQIDKNPQFLKELREFVDSFQMRN